MQGEQALPLQRLERLAYVRRRRPADAADLDRPHGEERRLARDQVEDAGRTEGGSGDEEHAPGRDEPRDPREIGRAQPPSLRKRDDRHAAHFAAPLCAPTNALATDCC